MRKKIVALGTCVLAAGGAVLAYKKFNTKSSAVTTNAIASLKEFNGALQREIVRSHRDARDVCIATIAVNGLNTEGSPSTYDVVEKSFIAAVRGSDMLAGNGENEFYLLFPEAGLDEGYEAVERLQESLPATCSLAAGIAVWDHCETAAELVSRCVASMNGEDKATRGKISVSESKAEDPTWENITPSAAQ